MKGYSLTGLARDDLFEIWTVIALDNPPAADKLEADIYTACERLVAKPDLGHFRRDLTDRPLKFFNVRGTYLIVYDPATKPLEIVRILHAARDAVAELA